MSAFADIALTSAGKTVPPLGLGCWTFGGSHWGGADDDVSRAALTTALDIGITHWDTAFAYGNGHSESLIGEVLGGRREEIFLATKAFIGKRPKSISSALDESLKRLQTDYVDLYYIHWPRSGMDLRPHMEVLEEERQRGRLRAIGVSNFNVAQMEAVSEVGRIHTHQLCTNLYWRLAEAEIIPWCAAHDVSVVAYSPLAQGILTGKFARHPVFSPGDQRPQTVFFRNTVWPHLYTATERLKAIAAECGRPLAHLALQWVMSRPLVHAALAGARTADQVRANAEALKNPVGVDVLNALTAISEEVRAILPDESNIFAFYP